MISVRSRGNYKKTINYLRKAQKLDLKSILNRYGQLGVSLLEKSTPVDTAETAKAWGYVIERNSNGHRLVFTNSNVNNGANIAILLQYGHGTGNGGYVEGRDYINPVIRVLFDEMVEDLWKEVAGL